MFMWSFEPLQVYDPLPPAEVWINRSLAHVEEDLVAQGSLFPGVLRYPLLYHPHPKTRSR